MKEEKTKREERVRELGCSVVVNLTPQYLPPTESPALHWEVGYHMLLASNPCQEAGCQLTTHFTDFETEVLSNPL